MYIYNDISYAYCPSPTVIGVYCQDTLLRYPGSGSAAHNEVFGPESHAQ